MATDLGEKTSVGTEECYSAVPVSSGKMRSDTDVTGRSFVDAVWDKYNNDMALDGCVQIYVPKKGPAKITDSGHLILPWRVHVTDCGITEAGRHADMTGMCQHVTELDLAKNNLSSLEEVLQLIRCMPQLVFLNLTSNPLHSVAVSMATATPKVTSPAHAGPDSVIDGVTNKDTYSVTGSVVNSIIETVTKSAMDSVTNNVTDNASVTNSVTDIEVMVTTIVSRPSKVMSIIEGTDDVSSRKESDTKFTSSRVEVSTRNTSRYPETPAPHPNSSSPQDTAGADSGELLSSRLTAEDVKNVQECSLGSRAPLACGREFCTVRQLVLNDTGLEWEGVAMMLHLFPRLEELHLSLNQYSSVDLPHDFSYAPLTRLFFNKNHVGTWEHISRLGSAFPSLQQLFLAETSITSLDEDEERLAGSFPSLALLSLNKTQLSGWEEVERLRRFPALTDVRLQGIPFLESQEKLQRRQQLVARLPNISRLNGSAITEEERTDAERAFLRLFLDSQQKPGRYFELEKVYGRLAPLVKVNMKPQTVFKVDIVMDDRRESLELNVNQTVRDLKKFLQNIVGMPSSKFNVLYNDKQSLFSDHLKYPDKKLYTYNITDGDELIVIPKTCS